MESRDDIPTVIAIGVAAATVAAIAHEAIGHGLGCYAAGGKIALLTSILFTCDGGTAITDAGGPLGSLLCGLTMALALPLARPGTRAFAFLYLGVIINAGWFGGQLVYSAALVRDDWAFAAAGFGWPPAWRLAAIAAGVGVYLGAIRFLRRWPVQVSTVRTAYLAGVASAVIAGLLWHRAPLASAREAILAVGAAPLWLLISAPRTSQDAPTPRSRPWIVASAILYALFLAVEARGIGTLA